MMRAPASGFFAPCCLRSAIRPGISCSARRISLRPNSASDRSFDLERLAAGRLRGGERMQLLDHSCHASLSSVGFDRLVSS